MDTESLIYSGEGCLQSSDCQHCIVRPLPTVKLLYKDCLHNGNKELVIDAV